MVEKEAIENAAKEALAWPNSRKWDNKEKDERFKSCFGASSEVVARIWNLIEPNINEPGAEVKHLLWALVFMKVYSTEQIHCSIFDWPSERTFWKWSWYFVQKISELKDEVIRLDNRFMNGPNPNSNGIKCYLTVDCTDCPINEPFPFDEEMFSHKFNDPALKYEVAVCIRTGYIVWVNGPFVASTSDPTIFQNGLNNELADDEVVEMDGVYRACEKGRLSSQGTNTAERKQKAAARGRHEVVNGRLKQFSVLANKFRHMKPNKDTMMERHKWCFNAIAVITQLKFENGEKTFDVAYDVKYY